MHKRVLLEPFHKFKIKFLFLFKRNERSLQKILPSYM